MATKKARDQQTWAFKGAQTRAKKKLKELKGHPPTVTVETYRIASPLLEALDEKEAAGYIDRSVHYLRSARVGRSGTPGPDFLRIGRSIRYTKQDLDRWLEERTERVVSQKKGA